MKLSVCECQECKKQFFISDLIENLTTFKKDGMCLLSYISCPYGCFCHVEYVGETESV